MRSKLVVCFTLILFISCSMVFAAEITPKPPTFVQAVITKAIGLMPDELKTKLKTVEKEIATAATQPASAAQSAKTIRYFVESETGDGPNTFVEQFRSVRKKASEKPSYTALAPLLGKMSGTLIELCQPHHTEEKAFKSADHLTFDKSLDTAAVSLKTESDGNQKVTNPSDLAVKSAKKANELLAKANSSETDILKEAHSAVFTLAVNSMVDTWWTLLSVENPKTESEGITTSATDAAFIGNTRSLKFHLPTCKYLPAEKNRVYFKTKDEAINQGYVACKVCKP